MVAAQLEHLSPGDAVHAVVPGGGPDFAPADDKKVAGVGGVHEAVGVEHEPLIGAGGLRLEAGQHAVQLRVGVELGVLGVGQAAHLGHGGEANALAL